MLTRKLLRSRLAASATLPFYAKSASSSVNATAAARMMSKRSFSMSSPAFHHVARVTQPAPAFTADAVVGKDFKTVSLSDYKGTWLVLFFYPLDFTFV